MILSIIAFIDGVGFDPFFRGLLSVLTGVFVLIGGSYLLLATNSGSRTGGLIAAAGLTGWMFLMGIIWTIYAIGWVGEAESWALLEIHNDTAESQNDGLEFAFTERVGDLGQALTSYDLSSTVDATADADVQQAQAVVNARRDVDRLDGWRYLATSNPRRGEASAAALEFLAEEGIATTSIVPLTYGAYNVGGKPLLNPDISEDDPDKSAWVETFTDAPARILHKLDTIFVHFWHPQELVVIQVQGVVDEPTLPGEAPPVPSADEDKSIYSVVLERDRGGPLPALFGGVRVVPALFTIFNGIIFGVLLFVMHQRDLREQDIRKKAASGATA